MQISCHLCPGVEAKPRETLASILSIEPTTCSRKWLTHTVYETKGVSPCTMVGWFCFIGLGLYLDLVITRYKNLKSMSHKPLFLE